MKKQEFLDALRTRLSGLPGRDIEERVRFYGEMIDDRTEEGISEEEAVLAIGSPDEIAEEIVAQTPLFTIARERVRPKRKMKAWEIVLIVLGAPLWLPLLVAAIAVFLSLYVSVWAVIISLWSVFGALAGTAVGALAIGVTSLFGGALWRGVAMLGAGLFCAGAAILAFFGCREATWGLLRLTRLLVLQIKKGFAKKEADK